MKRAAQPILVTLLFVFLSFFVAEGQKVTIRMADKSYNEFAFIEAIKLYEVAYQKDPNDLHVIRRLADANRQVGRSPEVEKWLKLIVESGVYEPADLLAYSEALKSNGRYAEAEKWLKEYANKQPNDRFVNSRISLLEQIRILHRDSANYAIRPVSLNSQGSEMGAVFYRGQVVFSSTNAKGVATAPIYKWNELPYLSVYIGDRAPNGDILNVEPFAPKLRTAYHDGPVSFDPVNEKVYITRNNVSKTGASKGKDGGVNLKILIGGRENGKWEYRGELPFNNDNYSTGHPSVDMTGRVLYFASDMPGGYGGSDLYFTSFSDGFWSGPFNLGPEINTPGNEFFPFISNDGTLYFSSDGHGGLGGLDIFFSVPEEGFKTVENVGFPLNSPKDDFSFVLDETGTEGYFASNRNGGRGNDDLYFFRIKYIPVFITGVVKDKETGSLMDGVKVRIVNEFADTILTAFTSRDGKFQFEVNKGKQYIIHGQKEFYFATKDSVQTNKLRKNDAIFVELLLEEEPETPEPVMMEEENGEPLQVLRFENIEFEIGQWEISSEAGRTIDEVIAFLLKFPDTEIRIESHTDSRGDDELNLLLSKRRAKAAFDYIISKGIDPLRVGFEGYGETRLLNRCDDGVDCPEADHAANNRTIVKIVKKGEYKGKRVKRDVFYF